MSEAGRSLPWMRRARVGVLGALQAIADREPGVVALIRRALPGPVWTALRRAAAPVRIPEVRRAASIPVNRLPEGSARLRSDDDAPVASLIVVLHGQVAHTRLCFAAIRAYTEAPAYELIAVDSGSPDGTAAFLREAARDWPALRPLPIEDNVGFAAAVNRGAQQARGEVLCPMNNDVVVTPGWLARLIARLGADAVAALVGPSTNDSGDGATVPAAYQSLEDLLAFAAKSGVEHAGRADTVDKVALFCAAIRRADFEAFGGLDEGYGLGFFEDEDLCAALRRRGRRILVARDAFVHHAAGASFRTLDARAYVEQFEASRFRFERKWGVRWKAPA